MHYFFSDAHLGLGSPEKNRNREHAVVRFLDWVGNQNADSLWIVGDLFDYWFDYRTVIPRGFTRTLGAIAALSDAGISVEYVVGNHDFGHYRYFSEELGVTVHPGDVEREIAGRRCLIAHGDGKVANDTGYLILKKILRAKLSGMLFRLIHPDLGIGVASFSSRRSRDYTQKKIYGEQDSLSQYAQRILESGSYDLVIMGHNHLPLERMFTKGTYINLGAWLSGNYTYLSLDEHSCGLGLFETNSTL